NNISFFIGIIGGVFALIALIGAVRGKHGSKGLSIAGLVLAIVSCAIVLVTQSAYKAAIDKAVDEATSGSKPVATSAANADADKGGSEEEGDSADKGDAKDAGDSADKEDSKGKNSSDKDGDATSNDDESDSADDTDYLNLAVGQTVTLGDGLSVTVNSTSTETASYGDTKVVCINVTYANDGSDNASFNTYDWKGEDANGAQRGPTFFMDSTDELSSGKLSDGGTVTGNIYFEEGVTRVLYYSNMFNDSATAGWTL
ncbi:MAG: DUF4352 domain-containing protein, partial [Atopobiaceae bacterium]|nr:DUF4352 domain-containing protein [Atopobiaceae bacterium]